MEHKIYDFVVIGGGAAGFFCAINLAENNPDKKIIILEKSARFLDKVRISGGGRCNVTHACWVPKELIKFYPRGFKEMLGPFNRFMCGDMVDWLDKRGVEIRIEDDGRIFPASNSSSAIIDCYMNQAQKNKVELVTSEGMDHFKFNKGLFTITTSKGAQIKCSKLIIASGGTKTMWDLLKSKGLSIVTPVPSLFTFNIKNNVIKDLPGLSVQNVEINIPAFKMKSTGPVLMTHWGLSGPGILKLSSWAARKLHEVNYKFTIEINWINQTHQEAFENIQERKKSHGNEKVLLGNFFKLPKRLWKNMVHHLRIDNKNWADLNKKELNNLINILSRHTMNVNGKSTNKDEFVTSGGVELQEINFKTMEAKKIPGLFLAGEVLNIDALTGGFNFQSAWTTSWIIAQNEY